MTRVYLKKDQLTKEARAVLTEREITLLNGQVDLADWMLDYLRVHAPDLVPVRDLNVEKFKIDLAFPDQMIAVEIDGGQFKKGGGKHGGVRDYQKRRIVTKHGWTVIAYHAQEVRRSPLNVIKDIRWFLEHKKGVAQ
jgi:very-short-patch-repair endonuclease